MDPSVDHCLRKLAERVAGDLDDRRALLQIGYNLGRLSELTGAGRDLWDRWNGPAVAADREQLLGLLAELRTTSGDAAVRSEP